MAVMENLIQQNKKVLMVNTRGRADVPSSVKVIKGDVTKQENVLDICNSYNISIIYHCLGLPYQSWANLFPIMMDNIIEAAALNNIKIVYADNLYAYGPHNEPLKETFSYKPVGRKTQVRADVAMKLMNAHDSGKVKATIGRGADFYGPRVKNSALGQQVFNNLIAGKPADLLGNPDTLHSYIFIDDFAKGLIVLADHEEALGEIWHIPTPNPTSTRKIVKKIANELGIIPKYRIAGKFIVNIAGIFNSDMREFKELMYQHIHPFIVDSNKFQQRFLFATTPHDEAIRQTISWYQNNPKTLTT
ncbi:NAD-dependent epimerase/dehydratase family protein [Bacillus sp. T3]|uniref:NAD-dependent epimerase/dehydratase family protein n=1 Tax=Bacillus sp. T3 TaxID=467262 RepID=UPI0029811E52|nr:NAD-dependent epimerase/dehydratase family protein [Bacillus sp. T3]